MSETKNELFLAFVCDSETEQVLSTLSLEKLGMRTETHLGGVKAAIEALKNMRSPRILLVDISESELPVSDMHALAEAADPGLEVLTIGHRNDVGIFRDLIDLGVRDYIAKPISTSLIARGIEKLVAEQEGREVNTSFSSLGKTISFIGARGGVGVSTLAANTAWRLANTHSKRVGLVDLDMQAGILSQILDVESTHGFREALESPDRIDEVFVERVMVKQSDYLRVLCSEEQLNETMDFSPDGLRNLVQVMKNQFHYGVFDLPRNYVNKFNLSVLQQSDIIVIVSDLTILSIRDTVRLLKLLNDMKSGEQRIMIVANRAGLYKKGEIDIPIFEESIQRRIDCHIPFDAKTPLVSINEGRPLIEDGGAITEGIDKIINLLMGRQQNQKTSENKTFINFFFAKSK